MTVALLGLVAGNPAVEQIAQGVRVEIDVVGMGHGSQRGRLEGGPAVAGDPAKRVVHLQALALHVHESHADRGMGESALEPGLRSSRAAGTHAHTCTAGGLTAHAHSSRRCNLRTASWNRPTRLSPASAQGPTGARRERNLQRADKGAARARWLAPAHRDPACGPARSTAWATSSAGTTGLETC